MKKITIADVAKHANISKSTVSQYLNNRFDYMGEKTKERIAQSIRELDYKPNIVARSLKQKTTFTIGVIVANMLHVFSTQVLRAIEDVCHAQDYHVIVCNSDDDPKKEKKYIEMLHAKQVDGLIVFPTGENKELYEGMVNEQFPLLFMDRFVEGLNIDSFLIENEKAAKIAVDHFVSKGYENIAILTKELLKNVTPRVERVQGYKKALKAHGIEVAEKFIIGEEVEHIQEKLKEVFSLPTPPRAIIAGNDLVLIQILQFAKENEMNIPEDLGIIGIDEVSFASIYSPPLTTISYPSYEMGKDAAELLLKKIRKEENSMSSEIHRYQPELIERRSC
ncbi:LacI family DNA-binding transcriptional regulator [Jeotgalibacillus soli]|uniref:LacI family transcription regulator n=1 Tax=Jeotgalibacillus soli TaxID=889306 RepID=A0A0C2SD68_9BACL|nr:substrate-binding domain-containing protein [Jeotgalibacillus soli]KIL51914.1 LacI family transcription regulator [Jeotgalibacillus soli]